MWSDDTRAVKAREIFNNFKNLRLLEDISISSENVKTTTSQSLDQTVNSEVLNKVSKLEGMLTKLAYWFYW